MARISQSSSRGSTCGRQQVHKQSILTTLKSAFTCFGNKEDIVVTHSDKKDSDPSLTQPGAEPTTAMLNGSPIAAWAEPPHQSDSEDDDISVISLGEARQLAQLRIDGVGISTAPISPCKTSDDTLSKPSSTSTTPSKRSLPPIEPVYHRKAMSVLKKALRKGKVGDSAADKKAKKSKSSKKRQSKKTSSGVSKQENPNAKDLAKLVDLRKRTKEREQKLHSKQKELSSLTEKGDNTSKQQAKKLKKSLKSTERKLRKLQNEVLALESKLKSEQSAIKESGQARSDNRAVSNTITAKPQRVTVMPAIEARVLSIKAIPVNSAEELPARPSTAVRRFILAPNRAPITQRERMINEMEKIEKETHEAMFVRPQRPKAAHPSRVRSVTENVQEFLPYNLEHFDSDSEDEGPRQQRIDLGLEGMKKFEQQQNTKSSKTAKSVQFAKRADVESDDEDFDFLIGGESTTPSARPPTRCTNGMAKQILQERSPYHFNPFAR